MKYIIVEKRARYEFEKEVEIKLLDGWKLIGGVHYTPHWYMQAMIKEDETL